MIMSNNGQRELYSDKVKGTTKEIPQYGVSQPICTKPPSERDLRLTREVNIIFIYLIYKF